MRGLDENACAVAGICFATAGAAVIQVQQHLQRLLNDGMGLPPFDIDHKPHAASLVLELRVIKTQLDRGTGLLLLPAVACAVCSDRHVQEMRLSRETVSKDRES